MFWSLLALALTLGLALLLGAARALPRVWQQGRSKTGALLQPAEERRLLPTPRPRSLQPADEANPFFWLARRGSGSGRLLAVTMLGLAGVWLCFLLVSISRDRGEDAFVGCLFAAYAAHQLCKFAFAVEATRRPNDDKRSGALELLLVTPLSESQIIDGQLRAAKRSFRGWLWLLLLMNTLMTLSVVSFVRELHMNTDAQVTFAAMFVGGILLVWADAAAIARAGMVSGLQRATHPRAILATLRAVMLVPWAAILFFFLAMVGRAVSQWEPLKLVCLWVVVGLVTDLIVCGHSSAALRSGLRACMAEKRRSGQPAQPAPNLDLEPKQVTIGTPSG